MKVSISFCTTCMGRLQHLQQTLPANIEIAEHYNLDYEICLVNWGSKDGMHEWIMSNYSEMISNGKMKYIKLEKDLFEMAPAKNAAHALATKDHVCNLDADNFLTNEFIESLIRTFPNDNVVHRGGEGRDVGGRITISRTNFIKIGGYNSEFIYWGYDDIEFLDRCKFNKIKVVNYNNSKAISHDDSVRVENISIKNIKKSSRLSKQIRKKSVKKEKTIIDILKREKEIDSQ